MGRLVWNRLHFSKDPDTGKQHARLNPEDRVTKGPMAHPRIIDDTLWDQMKARQGAMETKDTDVPMRDRRRPKFLFFGLMACCCCGGRFSNVPKDGFACSTARKKARAVCTNVAVIKQAKLEARVLLALEHHLMDEEAVQILCEEYAVRPDACARPADCQCML
ncbi:hypothetical protein CUR21_17550 [Pseudorhodobacter sp. MZDSW-24AT]|nr:hypothetical protein CUR21_17550 [Pseudorhodobacter sp. MZDSW-24AT]